VLLVDSIQLAPSRKSINYFFKNKPKPHKITRKVTNSHADNLFNEKQFAFFANMKNISKFVAKIIRCGNKI
jgi:hypothetical protein